MVVSVRGGLGSLASLGGGGGGMGGGDVDCLVLYVV